MFSVEIKFKVLGKEVRLEQFASLFLLEELRTALREMQPKNTVPPAPSPSPIVPTSQHPRLEKKPLAVSITEASALLGISPATVRAYVARRTIHSIHIGRRVLIPFTAIHDLLEKGLQPARQRRDRSME